MNTVNEYLVVHVVHVVRSVWHWLLYDRLAMPVMVRRWPVPALCTSARARPPGKGGGAGRGRASRAWLPAGAERRCCVQQSAGSGADRSSTVAGKGARERGAVRPGRGRDRRGPTVATKRPYVVRTGDVTSVRSPAVHVCESGRTDTVSANVKNGRYRSRQKRDTSWPWTRRSM